MTKIGMEELIDILYGMYKIDWIYDHVTAESMVNAYAMYRMAIIAGEFCGAFEDWIEQYGIGGEVYACKGEFLGSEMLDRDYTKGLIGDNADLAGKLEEFYAMAESRKEAEPEGVLTVSSYYNGDALYLGLETKDHDETIMDITVNFPGEKVPKFSAFVDVNNGGQKVVDYIKENGLGEPTGEVIVSGMAEYPLYRFNREKLMELDPNGTMEYECLNA